MGTVGVIANDVYSPALPFIPSALNTSKSVVQLTVSVYMLAFSIAQLFYGPMSDGLGRRRVVLVGFVIAWFGTLLCYLSTSIALLMAGRAMQGLGISAGVVMYRAIMRDVYGKWARLSRYASYIMIAIAAILIGSLTLGGYLQQYFGWRANFVFMLVYILLFFILMLTKLPETNRYSSEARLAGSLTWRNYMKLFSNAEFMAAAILAGLSYSGLLIYFIEAPFLLQKQVGLTPVQYGWSAAAIAGFLALGNFINSIVVARSGTYAMILRGASLMTLSAICMLVAYALGHLNFWVIILPGFGFIFGVGLLFENATATALSPFPKMAGTAGAAYGFIQILSAAILSAVMSIPHAANQRALSMMWLCIALACLLLCVYFISRNRGDA